MKYICEPCNYSTDNTGNWCHHTKTQKHISNTANEKIHNKITKKPRCAYCNIEYSRINYLKTHLLRCPMFKERCIEDKLKMKYMEEKIIMLENTCDYQKNITEKSMSALNFLITKNYQPPQLIPYNIESLQGEKNDGEFVKILAKKYQYKHLTDFIGDALISQYKTDDPKNQSLWNSDSYRLHYIIRSITDHGSKWIIDKKGVSTKKTIIEPVLHEIEEILFAYLRNNFSTDVEISTHVTEMIQIIRSKELEKRVFEYITPHFHLNKT